MWGAVGLMVLVVGFGIAPAAIPGEVLLIVLTVIMAASAMEAAGGIDYLVQIAAGIIRKSPRHVTLIAPVVAYVFTFLSGTGHVFYPLLPVIYEVAMKGRVRPERPIAVATIGKNDFVGEIAILCDVPRTATIRSRTALTTLRITKDLFLRMLMDFPAIAIEVTRVLAQRLEHTTERLRDALARK